MNRSRLERELSRLADFESPRAALEQYRTPSEIAAHLCHLAGLQGDLDRTVVDLGCGTGVLGLGTALAGARRVVGIDRDRNALCVARENEHRLQPDRPVDWLHGDATAPPLSVSAVTVVMNPPFGAQQGNEHTDRAFLQTTASIASVSYSLHNAGSQAFVRSFTEDHEATITHAFAVEFDVPHQFDFHTDERRTIEAEAYRIDW